MIRDIQTNIEILQWKLKEVDYDLSEAFKHVKFYRESYGIEPSGLKENVTKLQEKQQMILGNIDLWKGFKKSNPNYGKR